ncbi:hypothetical protein B0H21DRAFT_834637 [Amylocystis lapponica]|nr:hypothetical protein B0H21DRAFT_834637 [Amylocystis lapponica]
MAPPPQIAQWLRRTYSKPQIDPEWLEGCYSWIEQEHQLDPATQMDEIIQHVDDQLLQSDLSDSMLAGTGLPQNIAELNTTFAGPILVEIISLTEIGHSAFSLQTTRQARLEYDDTADDEEDAAGWEYEPLPDIVLGETPLGFKDPQMLLRNVEIRKGLAYLQPKCVVMKGGQTADREVLRDVDFARSLRTRLGQPEDPAAEQPARPASPPPAAPPAANLPPPQPAVRSPLRELSPPVAGPSHVPYDDDAGQPRRRKLPSRANRSPSPLPPPRPPAQTQSRYFAIKSEENPSAGLARARVFSPHRLPPVVVPDSDEEDEKPPPPATRPLQAEDSFMQYTDTDDFADDAFREAALEQARRVEEQWFATGASGPPESSSSGSGSGTASAPAAVVSTAGEGSSSAAPRNVAESGLIWG